MTVWLCLAAAGCRLQSAETSTFVRVDSPHFVVYAAATERQAEKHARTLEAMLAGLLETGWDHHGSLPLKLNVILLESEAQVRELTREGTDGYFQDDVLFEHWVVLPLIRGEPRQALLVHELSHSLAQLALQNQPLWFQEGLAVYYETAQLTSGQFRLGVPAYGFIRVLQHEGILPAATLFSSTDPPNRRFYASAWLLVHYLMSNHGDAFVRYQELLGQGKSHRVAWSAALGLSDKSVDEALRAYLEADSYQMLTTEFEPEPVKLHTQRLNQADDEGIRAVLWQTCQVCTKEQRDARVQKHAQRALALDPKQPNARLLVAQRLPSAERGALLRQMTADTPDDVRGWLGLLFWTQAFRDTKAVQRALLLAPRHPLSRLALAAHQWQANDRSGALLEAQRALRIQPTNSLSLVLYARMLAELGRCDALTEVIRKLRGLVHSIVPAPTLAEQDELAKFCRASASR